MFTQGRIRHNRTRYAAVGVMVLLLLSIAPFAGAMGSESAITYGGDDAYDPAAGGNPGQSVAAGSYWSAIAASTFSGDDDYDPAAGGNPGQSVAAGSYWSAIAASTFSGDDVYDPAAGGEPEQFANAAAADVSSLSACDVSADEIAASKTLTNDGGFSGDDDYDRAAGGIPEMSLFAFAGNSMASCDAAISSN